MRNIILYSAFLFLLSFLNCEGCMEEEREALLQIKSSINSPEGTAFSSWYGEDCCQWEGVECDVSTSRVIKIFFLYRRMYEGQAWYPNATLFAQFEDLQELHLPGNGMGGFLSPNALHKLKHLRKLDLHDNFITDSSYICWGNIPTLYYLDLSRNRLQGYIPKWLCESRSLTDLFLSQNHLEGNIDLCLSNMTSLQHLYLSDNLFRGTFPSLIFQNLSNIQSFVISRNQFKDVISFSIFANLSKLSVLDLSYNPDLEIETESPTWSPSFSLYQLRLGGCNLNKRSGRNVPTFLSKQYHLESLDLSYNSLVGRFPSWLLGNISSALWIRGNNFSGSFPGSQRNTSSQLSTLDISDNMLYGTLPTNINLIFPELSSLNASGNMFNGTIPQSLGKMKQLSILDLSNNILQGEIPHGIFSNLTSLEGLTLSDNTLEGVGAIPRNLSMSSLRWLYLDRNGLMGSFLESISMCSYLQILSIVDNDMSGDLSRTFPVLTNLRVLLLRGNSFKGSIPLQLCQLKHLHILDLSENDLSGEIPICLDNITSWTQEYFFEDLKSDSWVSAEIIYKGKLLTFRATVLPLVCAIDISFNKLTGKIPSQVTGLRRIVSLNLSHNLLTGQIPASLANLRSMESLDLSYNEFCGHLPANLGDLTFLTFFNVSFNNLTGPLPLTIPAFDESSYQGNHFLCGLPLKKKCELEGKENNSKSKNRRSLIQIIGMSALTLLNAIFFFLEN